MEKSFNTTAFKRVVKSNRTIILCISMEVACEQIGISRPTLSRIENGSVPNMEVFIKILSWLGDCSSKYIELKQK